MQSPLPPGEGRQASEAATPGASVAVQFGGDCDREMPGFDTPGQASPARHRSQEGRPSLQDVAGANSNSRGRSAGFEAAAAALAEAEASAASPEPLAKLRLRVQGADIILEDAASPKDPPDANGGGGGGVQQQQQQQQQRRRQEDAAAAAGGGCAAAAAGGGGGGAAASGAQQAGGSAAVAAQQAAQRAAHEHELQLRLASRTGTGISNVAITSSKQPAGLPPAFADGLHRLESSQAVLEQLGAMERERAGGASLDGGPVRMKYRSTLTEENVAYLNKLDQYGARPDSTGRSSERIWRWLEGSGPPFDNPPPSLGVPTASKAYLAAASRRQASKRSWLSCFNCFGGGDS